MRTILVAALTANLVFSAGATYLQGAIASQSGAVSNNAVSTVASAASLPNQLNLKF
jgi:hypothetical protein